MSRSIVPVLLLLALVGCPVSTAPPPPPMSGGSTYLPPPTEPGPGSGAGSSVGAGSASEAPGPGQPDGAACIVAADCTSGVCEGQGWGDGAGRCVSRMRACTMDIQAYCGCDGATFSASGSCPGARFASRGACTSTAATARPVGAPCLAASECDSGVCEGQGCGSDQPGTCAARARGCTRDLRSYCGCDGQTFRASGSCPGQRFSARAACAP